MPAMPFRLTTVLNFRYDECRWIRSRLRLTFEPPIVEIRYRRANFSRVPCQLFYDVGKQDIWLLGIFPDRANPRDTLRRLSSRPFNSNGDEQ